MRKLLVLIVGLLLVSPVWAQSGSGKGMVDHVTTAELAAAPYVCDATTAGLHGLRVYDITANREMTCSETGAAWVTSGGTGAVFGDIEIEDVTPLLSFDDSNIFGSLATDGSIGLNCLTAADCDMTFTINHGGFFHDAMVIEGDAAATFWVDIGYPSAGLFTRVDQGGALSVRNTAPSISFWDNDEIASDSEASIDVQCATEGDCLMTVSVEADSVDVTPIRLWGSAVDTFDVQIGDAANTLGNGANYINIDEEGDITFLGNSRYQVTKEFQGTGMIEVAGACAAPATTTIGGGPIVKAMICTDADADMAYFSMVMPDNWNGTTFTAKMTLVNNNAAPADNFHTDIQAMCRGDNEVIDGTWGDKVGIDVDFDTPVYLQNDIIEIESGAITPDDGSIAGNLPGATCFFAWEVDEGGTDSGQMANTLILGFTIGYTIVDLDEVD